MNSVLIGDDTRLSAAHMLSGSKTRTVVGETACAAFSVTSLSSRTNAIGAAAGASFLSSRWTEAPRRRCWRT